MFIQLSVDESFSCYNILAIINNVAVDTNVQLCVWMPIFNVSKFIGRREILGSYGNSMASIWGIDKLFFHSRSILLHPHQETFKVLIFPHPCQNWLSIYIYIYICIHIIHYIISVYIIFIRKCPDAGKDQRQEQKLATQDEMVGCHHWLNGHDF